MKLVALVHMAMIDYHERLPLTKCYSTFDCLVAIDHVSGGGVKACAE